MSVLKQRFLLVSDMHYTTELMHAELVKIYPESKTCPAAGNAFGRTQREKIEKVYEDVMEENRRSPLDAVLVLGDLSVDDYDFRCLPYNYCKKFKEECMDRWPVPSYAIPGNHDSWPNELWKEVFGYDREYALEFGDTVFIMADTFATTPCSKKNPGGGSPINPIHDDFLRECLEKYKGKTFTQYTNRSDGETDWSEYQVTALGGVNNIYSQYIKPSAISFTPVTYVTAKHDIMTLYTELQNAIIALGGNI